MSRFTTILSWLVKLSALPVIMVCMIPFAFAGMLTTAFAWAYLMVRVSWAYFLAALTAVPDYFFRNHTCPAIGQVDYRVKLTGAWRSPIPPTNTPPFPPLPSYWTMNHVKPDRRRSTSGASPRARPPYTTNCQAPPLPGFENLPVIPGYERQPGEILLGDLRGYERDYETVLPRFDGPDDEDYQPPGQRESVFQGDPLYNEWKRRLDNLKERDSRFWEVRSRHTAVRRQVELDNASSPASVTPSSPCASRATSQRVTPSISVTPLSCVAMPRTVSPPSCVALPRTVSPPSTVVPASPVFPKRTSGSSVQEQQKKTRRQRGMNVFRYQSIFGPYHDAEDSDYEADSAYKADSGYQADSDVPGSSLW